MAAYLIYNQLEITDQDLWAEYRSKAGPGLAEYGARLLAFEPETKVLEGEWAGVHNMIFEFPDMDALERWYNSDDYKPLLEMRLGAARGNAIAVNGV